MNVLMQSYDNDSEVSATKVDAYQVGKWQKMII